MKKLAQSLGKFSVLVLFSVGVVHAGITWSIPAGPYSGTGISLPTQLQHAVGPTTYTIDCSGDLADSSDIRAVLGRDASGNPNVWYGDTISLAPGCNRQVNSSPIYISRPGGTDPTAYVTIQSSQASLLPGVRYAGNWCVCSGNACASGQFRQRLFL
jgi:hypothetical protein